MSFKPNFITAEIGFNQRKIKILTFVCEHCGSGVGVPLAENEDKDIITGAYCVICGELNGEE